MSQVTVAWLLLGYTLSFSNGGGFIGSLQHFGLAGLGPRTNHGGVPMVRNIDGLQPDRPATHDYEAFPEVFVPPFHYANPVSGKAW